MSAKRKTKYAPPFSLRIPDKERKALEDLAGGMPLGAFIRETIIRLIIKKKLTPSRGKGSSIDKKIAAMILAALGKSRIANNLNQLAKAANSGSLPVNEEVLRDLYEAVQFVRWMRDTLIKAMGLKPSSTNNPDELPNDFEG